MTQVAIIFGSRSDSEKMKGAAKCLKEFSVDYEAHILSAHRVPEKLFKTLTELEDKGVKVIIAGAGLAAHLPGVIASKTTLPVIGVPINAALNGQDALFSIVQMPKSIPVGCVGIDNSYNAAMLAVQILATSNADLSKRLKDFRTTMKDAFIADNKSVDL